MDPEAGDEGEAFVRRMAAVRRRGDTVIALMGAVGVIVLLGLGWLFWSLTDCPGDQIAVRRVMGGWICIDDPSNLPAPASAKGDEGSAGGVEGTPPL